MTNAAAQRALAEKLLSEARQALNTGEVDEARSLAHRAKGSLNEGEKIPGLAELIASLDSAEIIGDFGAFLKRGGSAALERDELEQEQRDVECGPRQETRSKRARSDDDELDEAEIRHRRSLRRGKLVAGGIFCTVMTVMVVNVVRVSMPDDYEPQQQCQPRARSVVAMPVLGGGPREPRLVTLDEIRRTFAEERIATHRRQQQARQRAVDAMVAASAGVGGDGGGAAATEAHGHVPGVTLTSVAAPQQRPGLVSSSPHMYVPAGAAPTFGAAVDVGSYSGGRHIAATRDGPYVPEAAATTSDSATATVDRTSRGRRAAVSAGMSEAAGREQGGRHVAGRARLARSGRNGKRTRAGGNGDRRGRPAGGRFFAADTTTRVKSVRKVKRTPQLQLPVGTEIEAMLDLGISSVRHGEVLARVQRSVEHGKTRIPQGAMLVGQSENDAKRIYVSFSKVLIDGRAFELRAIAIDDKMRGLRPDKREATVEERQGAEIAKGALDIVGAVAKRGVGQLAGRAVDGVIGEAKEEHEVDRTVVLSVPAGKHIIVKVLH